MQETWHSKLIPPLTNTPLLSLVPPKLQNNVRYPVGHLSSKVNWSRWIRMLLSKKVSTFIEARSKSILLISAQTSGVDIAQSVELNIILEITRGLSRHRCAPIVLTDVVSAGPFRLSLCATRKNNGDYRAVHGEVFVWQHFTRWFNTQRVMILIGIWQTDQIYHVHWKGNRAKTGPALRACSPQNRPTQKWNRNQQGAIHGK